MLDAPKVNEKETEKELKEKESDTKEEKRKENREKEIAEKEKDISLSDRENWRIHLLFVRKDYLACLQSIEKLLEVYKDNEFALYTKGILCFINPLHISFISLF
jgi:hypothetical protein